MRTAAGKFLGLGVKVFLSPRGSIGLGQLIPFSSVLFHLQPEFKVMCFYL